jgi:hypothetical protein
MNEKLKTFLQDLQNKKGQDIFVTLLFQSSILEGKFVELSNDLETITLSGIYRNNTFIQRSATITILSEHVIGWDATVKE